MLSTLATPYPFVDAETDEPRYTSDPQFSELFKVYEQVYHELDLENPIINDVGQFVGDQTLAMLPIYYLYSDWTGLKTATEEGMNWDIVTFPVWDKDNPRGVIGGGRWLGLTDFAENKDAAFKVLEFWLSRERVGDILEGAVSIPFTPEMTMEYVSEVGLDEQVADKNIEALFKYPGSEEKVDISKYQYDVYPIFTERLEEFINPSDGVKQDINSLLRELQEETEILIDELKQKE